MRLITNFMLYLSFCKEVNKEEIRQEAISWAKQYYKDKQVPRWTSEYIAEFPRQVEAYVSSYTHHYAKSKLEALQIAKPSKV